MRQNSKRSRWAIDPSDDRVSFTSHNRARWDGWSLSLLPRMEPPNPARIAFGEFQRLVAAKGLFRFHVRRRIARTGAHFEQFSPMSGNARTEWWMKQSAANCSLASNSLFNREITGNRFELGASTCSSA